LSSGPVRILRELELSNKLGKPVLHIYDTRKERIPNPDSLRLEIQALTDFLRSNKIAVLNVAGARESKEPGVYEWTLNMLRLFLNWTVSVAESADAARE
jgi:Circularly permutated YpsA SLOG family